MNYKTLFIGCEYFGEYGLLSLLNSHLSSKINVVGILTFTFNNEKNQIRKLAKTLNIPYYNLSPQNNTFGSEVYEWIKLLQPQFGIMMQFPLKIPEEIISIFSKLIINVHPTDLPIMRGGPPLEATILNNEKLVISIHQVTKNFDSGPVISKSSPISIKDMHFNEVYNLASHLAGDLLVKTFDDILCDKATFYKQNEALATYFSYKDLYNKLKFNSNSSVNDIYIILLAKIKDKGIYLNFTNNLGNNLSLLINKISYICTRTNYQHDNITLNLDDDEAHLTLLCKDGFIIIREFGCSVDIHELRLLCKNRNKLSLIIEGQ